MWTQKDNSRPAADKHGESRAPDTRGAAGPLPAEAGQVSEREARQVAEAAAAVDVVPELRRDHAGQAHFEDRAPDRDPGDDGRPPVAGR